MTAPARYIHYHVVRRTWTGNTALIADRQGRPRLFTIENAGREAAYRNIVEAESEYWPTFCHDEDCDKTRRPE